MKHVTLTLMLAASASIISMAAASPEQQPVHIARAALPVKFDNVVETIMIDNQRYEVPEPWAGNRLFPTTRNLDELRPIPPEYAYDGSEIYILAEALEPFVEMAARAHQDGVELLAESAYRSIHYQARIFKKRMKEGYRYEDIIRYVAPPGYSQHMLGTAVDFYPSNWEFAESEQYRWLQEHAGEFGFEETFSRHNRYNISWESWHWNYVGKAEPGLTAGIGTGIEEELERIE